jgi:hypothetical protein
MYPKLDPSELEPYFSKHMLAMTAEGLHSKADIAIQLAWRDKEIATLKEKQQENPYEGRYASCSFIPPQE